MRSLDNTKILESNVDSYKFVTINYSLNGQCYEFVTNRLFTLKATKLVECLCNLSQTVLDPIIFKEKNRQHCATNTNRFLMETITADS